MAKGKHWILPSSHRGTSERDQICAKSLELRPLRSRTWWFFLASEISYIERRVYSN
jgi:hypothetical protein